jgi:SAM-dependent methyltransferase
MTGRDVEYFRHCHGRGLVRGPFLDVGSMKVNEGIENLRDLALSLGVERALGCDFAAGPGVDVIADFSRPAADFRRDWSHGRFATVAIFNVLEHTFDPVTVLDNALSLVEPGGTLLAVIPSIWPIHNFPVDCLRFNPDWFRQYAVSRGVGLAEDDFHWLSEDFGLVPVGRLRRDGLDYYPSFHRLGRPALLRLTYAVNRLFPTYFRTHWHPVMVALGATWTVAAGPGAEA